MTSSPNSLEQLIVIRDKLLKTISDLEIGLLAEKRKADEYEFFRNDKKFDQTAMDAQVLRSKENIKTIQKVLDIEIVKLERTNQQIQEANKILAAHGTFPCLINAAPHTWHVLSRHPSGNFSHRKCLVCNTSEKVGYV